MKDKRQLYESIMTDVAKSVKTCLHNFNNENYDSEHLVAEMATFGHGKWGRLNYKVAVHGASTNDRPNPHIHIYYENETNPVHPQFNFEISLVDILTKDEINLIYQLDRKNNVKKTNRTETSWTGYSDLYEGFQKFLFDRPVSKSRRSGQFIDNLDRAIHEWNRETDQNGYENLNKNPLMEYISNKGLTVLAKYQKYFED